MTYIADKICKTVLVLLVVFNLTAYFHLLKIGNIGCIVVHLTKEEYEASSKGSIVSIVSKGSIRSTVSKHGLNYKVSKEKLNIW